MIHLGALALGFALDIIIGDPRKFPHIVVGMGKMISLLERFLRWLFPKTNGGELGGGIVLAVLLPLFSLGLSWGLLYLFWLIHPLAALAVEGLLCWQCLAARSLQKESMKVYHPLKKGDLPAARSELSMIVGRDTANLDEEETARAAVETIAENTNDGIIAPLLFMAVGGAPAGVFYKAINTMDSMVGYKNDNYLYFGRAAARLDDAVNFIPARIAALLMAASSFFCGYDAKRAWRIYRRDRKNHKSPNSAHTEAVCAGALGVQLGGDSYYFGKLVRKPTIGDSTRMIELEDIRRANRLMYWTASFCFVLCAAVKGLIIWL